MKSFACVVLTALMSFSSSALRLEDTMNINLSSEVPDVSELDESSDIVAAAMPLIECVLENEDDETVKEIVAGVLNHDLDN